jgi:hypothetical protein
MTAYQPPSVVEALDTFYLEHRRCGELEGGVDEDHIWLACSVCDAQSVQRASGS